VAVFCYQFVSLTVFLRNFGDYFVFFSLSGFFFGVCVSFADDPELLAYIFVRRYQIVAEFAGGKTQHTRFDRLKLYQRVGGYDTHRKVPSDLLRQLGNVNVAKLALFCVNHVNAMIAEFSLGSTLYVVGVKHHNNVASGKGLEVRQKIAKCVSCALKIVFSYIRKLVPGKYQIVPVNDVKPFLYLEVSTITFG